MNAEFFGALAQLEKEKGISMDYMLERVSNALIAAYKKDEAGRSDNKYKIENVYVEPDLESKEINMYAKKEVVDIVEDPLTEISLEDARLINKATEYGDIVPVDIKTKEFGRIAAGTAKQVIIQAIREAERGMVTAEFSSKEHEILTATIMRVDPKTGNALLEMTTKGEKIEGTLHTNEQAKNDILVEGEHIKVYVLEVKKNAKGHPQISISRTHPGLVKRLFELEVPEIEQGIVEIKSIAREAGNRTKMAVYSKDENIDPIGACVGKMQARVSAVVSEIGGEKIDIIKYNEDVATFVAAALAPATVVACKVLEGAKSCVAVVPDNELSLAIGKEGQNARLAAKLTGSKIDIKPESAVDLENF